MSSGFVSGGTIDKPIQRDEEWLKAQQELEASRLRKEEEGKQQDGKSLYEVLQNNKAAKQEAFEESARLKHQFRALDDDEVEFLDSVLESTRAKEEAVKRETTEQLDIFRKHQEEADRALLGQSDSPAGVPEGSRQAGSPTSEESQWAVNARKRKRVKEKESLPGVKLRKSSSTVKNVPGSNSKSPLASSPKAGATDSPLKPLQSIGPSKPTKTVKSAVPGPEDKQATVTVSNSANSRLGLAGYSSDEED